MKDIIILFIAFVFFAFMLLNSMTNIINNSMATRAEIEKNCTIKYKGIALLDMPVDEDNCYKILKR